MKIMSARPCLRLGTNLAPRVAFWDPDLGPILGLVLGSFFGHRFESLQVKTKSEAPKWYTHLDGVWHFPFPFYVDKVLS
jgi:hypothetical protein